ncbi:hypothetical protein RIR_jg23353.t1 [Rhizophagus irregularis DAOM 181602=DAOM 197198]|nr:hypothetical protein RIR_jg23353.t1 [Rhizophagus irregularis DAOM 181602=DAOM 197198]
MAAIIDIICHASPTWDEVIWAKKEAKRIYRRQVIEIQKKIPYKTSIANAELLRRTPPPNNESTSTISEATVSSRAETTMFDIVPMDKSKGEKSSLKLKDIRVRISNTWMIDFGCFLMCND